MSILVIISNAYKNALNMAKFLSTYPQRYPPKVWLYTTLQNKKNKAPTTHINLRLNGLIKQENTSDI